MNLKKEHANKLINIDASPVVFIAAGEFSAGDTLILFNGRNEHITIQSSVPKSFRSGNTAHSGFIEFPPNCLMNAVFIDSDTVVFVRGYA